MQENEGSQMDMSSQASTYVVCSTTQPSCFAFKAFLKDRSFACIASLFPNLHNGAIAAPSDLQLKEDWPHQGTVSLTG